MILSRKEDIKVGCLGQVLHLQVREGLKKKKKLTEFSVKVGGWGQQRTNFPLFFFLKKKHKLKTLDIA